MILGNKNIQPDARALALLLGGGGDVACILRCPDLDNTIGGDRAGENIDLTGLAQENTLIGDSAGRELTVGDANTLIGSNAGLRLTTQYGNTMVGYGAGVYTDGASAWYNTYLGTDAGLFNDGHRNVCVGSLTGMGWSVITADYDHNAIVGYAAGWNLKTGSYNSILGSEAGDNITDGGYNICLGYRAGDLITTGTHCIIVGQNADPPAANSTYALNVGDLIYGKMDDDNMGLNVNAYAGGQGVLAIANASTNPVGGVANTAIFYVSAGEMWVQDSGGVNTQLSSHKGGEWVHRDIRDGREYVVYLERLVREFEKMTGKRFSEVLDA